jgi:hypothetical protein
VWWFSKGKRKEIWDDNIQWPIGDIEAAHRIREIYRSADDSAEKVGAFADRPDSKKKKYEVEWYQRAAKVVMEIAIKISDDLLRDSAVRQIVSLCVKANDLRTAQILLRAIQAVSFKEDAQWPSCASAMNLLSVEIAAVGGAAGAVCERGFRSHREQSTPERAAAAALRIAAASFLPMRRRRTGGTVLPRA